MSVRNGMGIFLLLSHSLVFTFIALDGISSIDFEYIFEFL